MTWIMDPTVFPSVDIQCNWDEVRPGMKTVHGNLSKSGQAGDDCFVVRDHSKQHSITIECSKANIITTFVRPRRVLPLCDRKLSCGDVSESGGLGVCCSDNGQLWVWDADSGETRRTLSGHVGDVYRCHFFPSGVVVLSGGADCQLKIWSALDGSCPRTLVGHSRGINDTAIVDRGRNIISVSGDGTAKLWDCGTGACLTTMGSTQCPINACALHVCNGILTESSLAPPIEPEYGTAGKLLLLACEDSVLRGCDVRNRDTVFSCETGKSPLSSCAFVSEFQALTGSEDGVISTVDLRNPDVPMSRVSFGKSPVTSLLPLNEDKCISGLSDGGCVVWSLSRDQGATFIKLTGPDIDPITSVRHSAGKLYTTCRDGCVRVYQCTDVL